MELRHLAYFVAVAEELNFNRAAQQLHITQPSLSRQIHDLERELQVELFDRAKHPIELTESGQLFLEQARQLLQQAQNAVESIQKVKQGETGRVVVGYNQHGGCGLLPRILQAFHASYPGVEMVLRPLVTQASQYQSLAEGEIDLGFLVGISPTFEKIAQAELTCEHLTEESMIAVLPDNHVRASQPQITLGELEQEPFIGHPGLSLNLNLDTYEYTTDFFEAAGFKPRITMTFGQASLGQDPVAAGHGVSLVPASAQTSQRKGVVYRPLVETMKATHTLIWATQNTRSVVNNFLKVARLVSK